MPTIKTQRVHLPGLRMQPLAPHLSALGLLRLINAQWLPECRGGWHGGHFFLQGDLDAEELVDFLFLRYQPTPIASPWSSSSGLYPGGDLRPRLAIESSTEKRLQPYRETIEVVQGLLAQQGLTQAPTGEAKMRLMKALGERLPEESMAWPRLVYRLAGDSIEYNPLLFYGGVDAKFDFAQAFMATVKHVLLAQRRRELRQAHLQAYLFDTPIADLRSQTHGAIEPSSASALNGSDLGDAGPLSNPWSYLLAMEGMLGLSRARHMRPSSVTRQAALLRSELEKPDLWLPIWSEPLTFAEMSDALQTRSPLVAARYRYAAVPRNGKAHFMVTVAYRPVLAKAFWMEPKRWLLENNQLSDGYTRAIAHHSDSGAPASTLAPALEELGKLKLHATPIPALQHGWIDRHDQSVEMSLALAIAGLGGGEDIHEHLGMRWQMRAFRGPDLSAMMVALARRRIEVAGHRSKKSNRHGIVRFNGSFWSCCPASVATLEAFLFHSLDESRVARLVHALCLLAPGFSRTAERDTVYRLPLAYRYLKLAFHQNGGDRRPPPRDVLGSLSEGRVADALRNARTFLAKRHDNLLNFEGLPNEDVHGPRLAAAMLIPISDELYEDFRKSVSLGVRG